jgi:hypothetical protein
MITNEAQLIRSLALPMSDQQLERIRRPAASAERLRRVPESAELQQELANLPKWRSLEGRAGGAITRQFVFTDFSHVSA